MRALTIGTSLAFSILGGNVCSAAPFCDDIKAVLAASSNISDLAGRTKSPSSWETKRNVSGFSLCEVQRLKKGALTFFCKGTTSRSFDDAKRDYDRLQKDIEACLPAPSWYHMVTANGQDINMHGFNLVSDGSSGVVSLFKNFDIDSQTAKTTDVWFPALTIYERKK